MPYGSPATCARDGAGSDRCQDHDPNAPLLPEIVAGGRSAGWQAFVIGRAAKSTPPRNANFVGRTCGPSLQAATFASQ